MLPISSNYGRTGLKNLGNTCFMNSALQCLSFTEDLTKYFLLNNDEYMKNEINKNNKYGSGGSIAYAYKDLIIELWKNNLKENVDNSSNYYISPWDFRKIFISFIKKFSGITQHDSHEMISFLLDSLHEDLNRIKIKPYQELNEKSNDESDEDAAERYWLSHIRRENSIIVDLFHGQYKSTIKCLECGRNSITFDPFMYLSLPIPESPLNKQTINFNVIDSDGNMRFYKAEVDTTTTVNDVKEIIMNTINTENNTYNFYDIISVAINNNNKVPGKLNLVKTRIFFLYKNNYEIVFYKISFNKNNKKTDSLDLKKIVFVLPVDKFSNESNCNINSINYPQPFYIDNNDKTFDCFKTDIIKMFFKYFNKISRVTQKLTTEQISEEFKVVDINNHEYLKELSDIYFDKNNNYENTYINKNYENLTCNRNSNNIFYVNLSLFNNYPDKNSNELSLCRFCKEDNCKYCNYNNFNNKTVNNVAQSLDKPLIILLEIPPNLKSQLAVRYQKILSINNQTLKKSFNCNTNDFKISESNNSLAEVVEKSNITLYDCLDMFYKTERLDKNNSWYCNKCKEFREINKTLNIYKAPLYLIIQLKRFKAGSDNLILGSIISKKNESLIDFPISNFNINKYIKKYNSLDSLSNEENNYIYDLYAVSQHYGNLNGGHYTTISKSNSNWFKFDDHYVYKIDENNVVDNSAYMLFYKKRILY